MSDLLHRAPSQGDRQVVATENRPATASEFTSGRAATTFYRGRLHRRCRQPRGLPSAFSIDQRHRPHSFMDDYIPRLRRRGQRRPYPPAGDPHLQGEGAAHPGARPKDAHLVRANAPGCSGNVYFPTQADRVRDVRTRLRRTAGSPPASFGTAMVPPPRSTLTRSFSSVWRAPTSTSPASLAWRPKPPTSVPAGFPFTHSKSIAVVCFNVRAGPALPRPTEPPSDAARQEPTAAGVKMMSEEQVDLYRALGMAPRPFEQVRVFAYKSDGHTLSTTRTHPQARRRPAPMGPEGCDWRHPLAGQPRRHGREGRRSWRRCASGWIPGRCSPLRSWRAAEPDHQELDANEQSTYQSHQSPRSARCATASRTSPDAARG